MKSYKQCSLVSTNIQSLSWSSYLQSKFLDSLKELCTLLHKVFRLCEKVLCCLERTLTSREEIDRESHAGHVLRSSNDLVLRFFPLLRLRVHLGSYQLHLQTKFGNLSLFLNFKKNQFKVKNCTGQFKVKNIIVSVEQVRGKQPAQSC